VRAIQYTDDLLDHCITVRKHFVIPKTEHAIASLLERAGSMLIRLRVLHVLTAVEFDYQPNFHTTKVGDIWTNWMLSANFSIAKLSITQS
jgi:hypothetical protein